MEKITETTTKLVEIKQAHDAIEDRIKEFKHELSVLNQETRSQHLTKEICGEAVEFNEPVVLAEHNFVTKYPKILVTPIFSDNHGSLSRPEFGVKLQPTNSNTPLVRSFEYSKTWDWRYYAILLKQIPSLLTQIRNNIQENYTKYKDI